MFLLVVDTCYCLSFCIIMWKAYGFASTSMWVFVLYIYIYFAEVEFRYKAIIWLVKSEFAAKIHFFAGRSLINGDSKKCFNYF